MTGYPLVLDGAALRVVVAGGGTVAERKVRALLEAGAQVRAIAPAACSGLLALAGHPRLELVGRTWVPGDVGDAVLVIAATDDRHVNAIVAEEGRASCRLVNVADDPTKGNCVTVASHRAGDLLVAVYAGGVPSAAARIRDAIAARFDGRYGQALHALSALRARMLANGDRDAWQRAGDALVGEDFCESVEESAFATRVAQWR